MLRTPILFIVFNRMDTAQQVFNAIRVVQPRKLYFVCDGPRSHIIGEQEKCMQTQSLIQQVDWPCELHTNFLEQNEGPSKAPYQFIKWFFDQEEQGIILEHDCLPHPDFFTYCEILLDKYKDNKQIGAISGPNFVPVPNATNSYSFTIYNHIWGWATWKRTIDLYTLDFSDFSLKEFNSLLNQYFDTQKEKAYWRTNFQQIKKGRIPTWDYYLTFCLWRNHLYSISPNKNLVSNIGFGAGAVNTTDPNSPVANRPTFSILPLIHNEKIELNKKQEKNYFKLFIMDNKPVYVLYLKLLLKKLGIFKTIYSLKKKLSKK